ncbi:FAD:protein FMN transferase [Aeromicrobium sp. Leaf350]|uniref:FAD:protein FMN transferase n=1 Tax=Aeromicrobium sp. Leaf350 TaxID=2876565 RepID=UPI001E2C9078|nr:FAD:protein FMN transferase [Aeromicrobium sp. Leaf350]
MASTRPSTRSRPRPLPEPWRFEAIGTAWTVDTSEDVSAEQRAGVADLVREIDRTWSRFREDGGVARLRAGETVDLGPGAAELLDLYDELHDATDGAVNPLVGGGLEVLGYDAAYTLTRHGDPVAAPAWSTARRVGTTLQVPVGAVLDVGAAGKGWLVDRVATQLVEAGHAPTVDAGGDIAHHGTAPIRVAMEHPGDPTLAVGVVDLQPGLALCGSAVNRRAWGEGLHHVLDARTGRPTRGVVASWVVARTAAVADGAATALFFVPPARLAALDVEAAWIDDEGLHTTPDFPGEVFS